MTSQYTVVAPLGRRIMARLISGLLSITLYVAFLGALFSLNSQALWICTFLIVACALAELCLILIKGCYLGQLVLRMATYSIATMRPSGGRLLVKLLLQGLVAGLTFGLAEVIISLASFRNGQTWFDRIVQTIVLEKPRGGAPVNESIDERPVPSSAISSVRLESMPIIHAPTTAVAALPQLAAPVEPVAGTGDRPAALDPVVSTPLPDQVITSVPFATSRQTRPAAPPDQEAIPAVALRSTAPVPDSPDLRTTEAASDTALLAAVPGPALLLDDGTMIPLPGSVALGRDPVVPRNHPEAIPLALTDQSMRLSKTHLVARRVGETVSVVDLHSTNGVEIAGQDGAHRLTPGEPVTVNRGDRVHLGGRWFEVQL